MDSAIIVAAAAGGAAALLGAAGLALARCRRYAANAEAAYYQGSETWSRPDRVDDGLACYRRPAACLSDGTPVPALSRPILLLPYPHAATACPMIDGPLARLLAGLGREVISFDPPGAYASTRPASCTMAEMLDAAETCLDAFGIAGPVDVVGHSMGAYCALALAIERPGRVARLALEGGLSGFPASTRHGLPGRWLRPGQAGFGLFTLGGLRVSLGLARMGLMHRFLDFYQTQTIANPALRAPWPLRPGCEGAPVPVRARWTLNLFAGLDHAKRLGEVGCPTLVLVGELDRQTPLPCAEELAAGIVGARLVSFATSGHAPHLEEPETFAAALKQFLAL